MSTRTKRLALALLLCGGFLAALGLVSQALTRSAGAGEAASGAVVFSTGAGHFGTLWHVPGKRGEVQNRLES